MPWLGVLLASVFGVADATRGMVERTADSGHDQIAWHRPLTAREAAAALGLSERTIRRAIGRGELTAAKHGGIFQIAPTDLAHFRETHAGLGHPPPRLLRLVPPAHRESVASRSLPAPTTSLIGREREVAAVEALLRQPDGPRLLVLTGPGGVGKTRLALAVAPAAADAFADGVTFISLAAVRDPALVAATIAKAVDVRETRDSPLVAQIAARLAAKHLLLVLDNFEHLVDAGPLVGELLAACPRLTVLATSRARLRLTGEHDVPVLPLPLPAGDGPLAPQDIAQSAAVQLFVARARAVSAGFTLTEENASAVSEICRRLDGLPLAIELAAARSAVLSPPALRARLEWRLPVLTGGPRDAPARQRTLRDAVAWSYDLLSRSEQAIFRRLAVCSGGCTFGTVAAVALDGETIGDSLEVVSSLVDKSLLQQTDGTGAEPRFKMLETVREYGLEQLQAQGELERARHRHAAYFLSFAEAADAKLRGREQIAHLALLEAEHDNLRAALAWSLEAPDRAETALRLVGALHWFWFLRDCFSEGLRWLEAALAHAAAEEPTPARVKARTGAGLLAFPYYDYAVASAHLQQGIADGRALRDVTGVAYALHLLGWGGLFQVDRTEPLSLLAESVALFREAGDRWGLATALCTLGAAAIISVQPEEAAAPLAESLALARELEDSWVLARALNYSGELARIRGNHDQARARYEESLALYRELDFRAAIGMLLHNLGYVAQHQGNPRRGLACFTAALAEHVKSGERLGIGHCLGGVAGMVGLLAHPEPAARLFGAVEAFFASIGASVWPTDKVDYDRNLETTRARLGEDAFAAAFAAGQALSLEQAAAEAAAVMATLGVTTGTGEGVAGMAPSAPDFGLTPRELEVLRLVAGHATDQQIADQLSISPRTVMHHVSHILAKLGVDNRRAAAIWAVQHDVA